VELFDACAFYQTHNLGEASGRLIIKSLPLTYLGLTCRDADAAGQLSEHAVQQLPRRNRAEVAASTLILRES